MRESFQDYSLIQDFEADLESHPQNPDFSIFQ